MDTTPSKREQAIVYGLALIICAAIILGLTWPGLLLPAGWPW